MGTLIPLAAVWVAHLLVQPAYTQTGTRYCNETTHTYSDCPNWVLFGSLTCNQVIANPTLCKAQGTCQQTGYEACCGCPTPSPTSSPSPSVSPTITPSKSTTPSVTVSPSPSPSPSSESEFSFPQALSWLEIKGAGTSGWGDTSNTQTHAMSGLFGSAISVTTALTDVLNFLELDTETVGFMISAVSFTAQWDPSAVASATGDIAFGFLNEIGNLTSGPMQSISLNKIAVSSNIVVSVSGGDRIGSSMVLIDDLDGDLMPEILAGSKDSDSPVQQAGSFFVFFPKIAQIGTSSSGKRLVQLKLSKFYEYGFGSVQTEGFISISINQTLESSALWYELGTATEFYGIGSDGHVIVLLGSPGCKRCYDQDASIDKHTPWTFPGSFWIVSLATTSGGLASGQSPGAWRFSHRVGVAEMQAFISLTSESAFGYSIKVGPDFDRDGRREIIVSAPGLNTNRGAVFVVSMQPDSSGPHISWVKQIQLPFSLYDSQFFGSSLEILPDLNGDGLEELAIGASAKQTRNDFYGTGSVFVLSLNLSRTDVCTYYNNKYGLFLEDVGVDCDNSATTPMLLSQYFPQEPVPDFHVKYYNEIGSTTVPELVVGDGFGGAVAYMGDTAGERRMLIGAPFRSSSTGSAFVVNLPARSPSPTSSPKPSPSPSSSAVCAENTCTGACHYTCGGTCHSEFLTQCGWEDCLSCPPGQTLTELNTQCHAGSCLPQGTTPCQGCPSNSSLNTTPSVSATIVGNQVRVDVTSYGAQLVFVALDPSESFGAACPPASSSVVVSQTSSCIRTLTYFWDWSVLLNCTAHTHTVSEALDSHVIKLFVVDSEETTISNLYTYCIDVFFEAQVEFALVRSGAGSSVATITSELRGASAMVDRAAYNLETQMLHLGVLFVVSFPFTLTSSNNTLQSSTHAVTATIQPERTVCEANGACTIFASFALPIAGCGVGVFTGDTLQFPFTAECRGGDGVPCPTLEPQQGVFVLDVPADLVTCETLVVDGKASLVAQTTLFQAGLSDEASATGSFEETQPITVIIDVISALVAVTQARLRELVVCQRATYAEAVNNACSSTPTQMHWLLLNTTTGLYDTSPFFDLLEISGNPNQFSFVDGQSQQNKLRVTYNILQDLVTPEDPTVFLRMEIAADQIRGKGFDDAGSNKKSIHPHPHHNTINESPKLSRIAATHHVINLRHRTALAKEDEDQQLRLLSLVPRQLSHSTGYFECYFGFLMFGVLVIIGFYALRFGVRASTSLLAKECSTV